MAVETLVLWIFVVALLGAAGFWLYTRRVIADPAYYVRLLAAAEEANKSNQIKRARRLYTKVIRGIARVKVPDATLKEHQGQAYLALGHMNTAADQSVQAMESYREAVRLLAAPPPDIIFAVAEDYARVHDRSPAAVDAYVTYMARRRGNRAADDIVERELQSQCAVGSSTGPNQLQNIVALTERVITADPDPAWPYYWGGRAYWGLTEPAQAQKLYAQAEERAPENPAIPYYSGLALASLEQHLDALAAFERSLVLHADQPEAHYNSALMLTILATSDFSERTERLEQALGHARLACELDADQGRYFNLRGRIESEQGAFAAALDSFSEAVHRAPGEFHYHFDKASVATTLGARSVAIEALRGALAIDNNHVQANVNLADLLLADSLPEEAERYYRQALTINSEAEAAQIGLGRALFVQGRDTEAAAIFAGVRHLTPEGRYTFGRVLLRLGQAGEAITELEDYTKERSADGVGLFYLGSAYAHTDQWDRAAQAYAAAETALTGEYSLTPVAPLVLGDCLIRVERWTEASEAYGRALALRPEDPRCHYSIGQLHGLTGDWRTARTAFERALSFDTGYAPALFGLGRALEAGAEFVQAATAYRQGLAAQPDWAQGWLRLGVVEAKLEHWVAATQALEKAHNLGLQNDELVAYLGAVRAQAKDYEAALSVWQGLTFEPKEETPLGQSVADAAFRFGTEQLASEVYPEAISAFENALHVAPTSAAVGIAIQEACVRYAQSLLTTTYDEAHRHEALAQLKRATELDPEDTRPPLYTAVVALLKGAPTEARMLLDHLVLHHPTEPVFLYHLAWSALAVGDATAAKTHLRAITPHAEAFFPGWQIASGNVALLEGFWEAAYEHYADSLGRRVTALIGEPIDREGSATADEQFGQDEPGNIMPSTCYVCGSQADDASGWLVDYHMIACPDCLDALLARLVVCAKQANRLSEASLLLEALAPLAGPLAPLHGYRGILRGLQGDTSGALSLLGPLHEAGTVSSTLAGAIARLYFRKSQSSAAEGDLSDAAEHMAQAAAADRTYRAAEQGLEVLKSWHLVNLAQSGRLTEALQAWENVLRNQPFDLALIHHVAILSYRNASVLSTTQPSSDELTGRGFEAHWRRAISTWATVLSSPSFWSMWREERLQDAGMSLSDDDLVMLREQFAEAFTRDLRDLASLAREAGTEGLVRQYEELELLWGYELRAAKVMSEVGPQHSVTGWPRGFACGTLMLEQLAPVPQARQPVRAMRTWLNDEADDKPLTLRRYFSPLGRYYYLLDDQRQDQAISELEHVASWPEATQLLADLLCMKGDELSQLGQGSEAIRYYDRARAYGADLTGRIEAVVSACMQASRSVQADDEQSYDEALAVLETGKQLIGDHPELLDGLAGIYAQKARMANNADRYAEAVAFIRFANQYRPGESQTLHFSRVILINWATELANKGEFEAALTHAREGLGYEYDEDAVKSLVFTFLKQKRYLELVSLVEVALEYDPDNPEYRFYHDRTLQLEGDRILSDRSVLNFAERAKAAEVLLDRTDPETIDSQVVTLRIVIYSLTGRKDEVFSYLERVLPNDSAFSSLRIRYLLDGLDEVKQALHVAMHNQGVKLLNEKKYVQAAAVLRGALRLDFSDDTRKMYAVSLAAQASELAGTDRAAARRLMREAAFHDAEEERWQQAVAALS